MATLDELWSTWLETTVLWWGPQGAATTAAGPWWTELPGPAPVFAITAWNPHGDERPQEENDRRHGELLRWALDEVGDPFAGADPWGADIGTPDQRHGEDPIAEADADGGRGVVPPRTWVPAAGAGLEPGPPELGLLLVGVGRDEAIAAGRRFEQLALFELTETEQIVLPCDGSPTGGRPRERRAAGRSGVSGWLTVDVVGGWWDAHARALSAHGVEVAPTPRCPRCGGRMAWIQWGMPASEPPPWVVIGGCIVDGRRMACPSCGDGDVV